MTGSSTYKITQVVGTSSESFSDAVENGLKRAASTLHGLAWFEVVEQRGRCGDDGTVDEFQVKMDIGFKLD